MNSQQAGISIFGNFLLAEALLNVPSWLQYLTAINLGATLGIIIGLKIDISNLKFKWYMLKYGTGTA